MKFENKNIEHITPYKLASHKVWDEIDNIDILKLDWNEATIQSSPKVKERVLDTIEKIGFRYYPDVHNKELINSLKDYVGCNSEQVQYFASSDAAQEYISTVFLTEGDKVLILGPTYDNFRLTCQSRGGVVLYSEYGDGFNFDIKTYKKDLCKHKPKLAYICNPNNPTGTLIPKVEIEEIVTEFPNVLFLVDEAYYEFSGESCSELAAKFDNVIVTRTFSKAFAIANFRVGYIVANRKIILAINKIRNAKNICSLSQEAAIAALSDVAYTKRYIDEVIKAKSYCEKELNNLFKAKYPVYCGSGNFILIDFLSEAEKSHYIAELNSNNIFVRDMGHVKAMSSYIRITIGTTLQMKRVLNVLKEAHRENKVCVC